MKWGLGQSYDRVEFLSQKTRAYLDIVKPASTVGIAGGFFLALVFYSYYTGDPDLFIREIDTVVFAVVTAALAHGGSQAMNMAEDAEMDRQTPHKQNRPIPSGVISVEEARSVAWIMFSFAIGRGFMVNWRFGTLIMAMSLMGVFYNLEPIRAKERVISIPWQATSRGLFMFPIAWSVFGDPLSPVAWTLGIFLFWYVFGFQNSADIIDRKTDEEFGVKTFAVMYGPEGVATIAAGATCMMIATVTGGIGLGVLRDYMAVLMGIIPFCIVMLYHMAYNPENVSETTGNHPAWLWFYIGMILTVSLPVAMEVYMSHT